MGYWGKGSMKILGKAIGVGMNIWAFNKFIIKPTKKGLIKLNKGKGR